jgi:hypothetical protein
VTANLGILFRVLYSLAAGSGFVVLVRSLGKLNWATPIPFYLLLPGELAFAFSKDSHFDGVGQLSPSGPISMSVFWVVNLAFWWVAAFLLSFVVKRHRN